LLTSDARMTSSVHHVFNFLTAYAERPRYNPLFVAPLNLGRNCVTLIERETANARAGKPAWIVAKFNALLEEKIIQALYRASQAGVQIDLIVRGACALRPGVRGLSSRIRVRSVIGRFLEHSRAFVFANGGKPEVYLGSADWMQRNIYERVEVMFHVRDAALCERIMGAVLAPYLADTAKTRLLQPGGEYVRAFDARRKAASRNGASRNGTQHGHHFNVQQFWIDYVEGREPLEAVPRPKMFAGAMEEEGADG
jgi:polyphosphate kinase